MNFAAHWEHARLVIDHAHGLGAGEVIARGSRLSADAPFRLQADGRTVATLHPIGPAGVYRGGQDIWVCPAP